MTAKPGDLIGFSDFKIPILKIPKLKSIRNLFNEPIYYREIESASETLIVVVHGMGGDSRYLTQFGLQLAGHTGHHIILPDLKYHGEMNTEKSVRLKHHEDVVMELEFLVENIKQRRAVTDVILIGHSLGGAVVLKWLLGKPPQSFKKVALIAPYLPEPYNVESKDFHLWLQRSENKIKLLFPEQAKWGSEVEEYDDSYIRSCLPERLSLQECLNLCADISLVVSQTDQILDIKKYRQHFQNEKNIKYFELPDLSHIGLVTSSQSSKQISALLF
jgi:hypothetical protein